MSSWKDGYARGCLERDKERETSASLRAEVERLRGALQGARGTLMDVFLGLDAAVLKIGQLVGDPHTKSKALMFVRDERDAAAKRIDRIDAALAASTTTKEPK
jgi:hypothetical protein